MQYTQVKTHDDIQKITKQIIKHLKASNKARDRKKVSYYNNAITFDIETSTNVTKNCAWVVVWQMSIDNDIILLGREIDTFVKLINNLDANLKRKIVVYVHNLSYEWQYIKKYFEWKKVFAIDKRTVYSCNLTNIIFKCSYALSGKSLDKTVENYDVKKAIGKWDYAKIRTPQTPLSEDEKEYALNDVISLVYYIQDKMQEYEAIDNIPLTRTGETRRRLLANIDTYYDSQKGKLKSGYEYYYHKYIKSAIPDYNTFVKLHTAFSGGFTHASLYNVGKDLDNITSYDICSSYPSVMIANDYPTKFYKVTADKFSYYYNKDYAIIATYRFKNLASKTGYGYISSYKCDYYDKRYIKDNGKIYRNGGDDCILDVTITEQDFDTICKVYDFDAVSIIGDIYVSKKQPLPTAYIQYIVKLYQHKTALKGVEGEEYNYAISKADLNSLYGVTVTNPLRDKYEYNGDVLIATPTDNVKELNKAYAQSKHPLGIYQWGVYVAAYARKNLMNMILNLEPKDFVYSDTDSIKCKNGQKYQKMIDEYNTQINAKITNRLQSLNLPSQFVTKRGEEKYLGTFEMEYIANKFKCLRSKTYIYTCDDKLHATVAGCSKKAIVKYLTSKTNGDINKVTEYFDYGLYINPNDTNKLSSKYIDNYTSDTIDGVQVNSLSSLVLLPCDFTIKQDIDYNLLFGEVQQLGY